MSFIETYINTHPNIFTCQVFDLVTENVVSYSRCLTNVSIWLYYVLDHKKKFFINMYLNFSIDHLNHN